MGKGRGNSTAETVGEALRINIDFLIKNKALIVGQEVRATMNFTNGASIEVIGHLIKWSEYIILRYKKGEVLHDYKVYIEEKESNLGKGLQYYFLCPQNGKRCKTLYMAYGSDIFKSRTAYKNRIYYNCQLSTKVFRTPNRYFDTESKIEKLKKRRYSNTYKGKTTKRRERLNALIEKLIYLDDKRHEELFEYMNRTGYFDINS